VGVAAALLGTLGTAPAGAQAPAPRSQTAAAAALTGEEAEALVRELVPRVEEIRGLKFKRPVPVKIVDAAAARAHFEARLKKFWPEAELRLEQRAYEQLGLLPPGLDLAAVLLDTVAEQAAGYYDPEQDTFFILSAMPKAMAPAIIVHELTHALDDQHYGIDALLAAAQADSDRGMALGSVVEGSGTLVMSGYLVKEVMAGRLSMATLQEIQQSEASKAEKLAKTPELLQRQLIAPYLLGQSFLLRGDLKRLAGGVVAEDIDRVFRTPVLSSEQILHPAKYWDASHADAPRVPPLPDLSRQLGPGFSLAAKNTLGELMMALLVSAKPIDLSSAQAMLSAEWTSDASRGWGGDAFHHYVDGGKAVTVLASYWDSDADAGEFAAAAKARGRRAWRYKDAVVIVAGDAEERAEDVAVQALTLISASASRR
jgi:hypothetical protein